MKTWLLNSKGFRVEGQKEIFKGENDEILWGDGQAKIFNEAIRNISESWSKEKGKEPTQDEQRECLTLALDETNCSLFTRYTLPDGRKMPPTVLRLKKAINEVCQLSDAISERRPNFQEIRSGFEYSLRSVRQPDLDHSEV